VVKNQQKAVKVLGIVLIIFLIAWGPFALINILSAVCRTCSISLFYLDIFTWFGKYLFSWSVRDIRAIARGIGRVHEQFEA
jgi:hypothetical protein